MKNILVLLFVFGFFSVSNACPHNGRAFSKCDSCKRVKNSTVSNVSQKGKGNVVQSSAGDNASNVNVQAKQIGLFVINKAPQVVVNNTQTSIRVTSELERCAEPRRVQGRCRPPQCVTPKAQEVLPPQPVSFQIPAPCREPVMVPVASHCPPPAPVRFRQPECPPGSHPTITGYTKVRTYYENGVPVGQQVLGWEPVQGNTAPYGHPVYQNTGHPSGAMFPAGNGGWQNQNYHHPQPQSFYGNQGGYGGHDPLGYEYGRRVAYDGYSIGESISNENYRRAMSYWAQ